MNLDLLASFGDHVPLTQFKPDDTIHTLSFSHSGQFLASGDQAGRIVIFQINQPKVQGGKYTVSFVNQVHAHKAQFDYFRCELSDPRINSVSWIQSNTINPLLLTCNSHEAKLWKMNQITKPSWGILDTTVSPDKFKLPSARQIETKYNTELVNTFTDLQTEYMIGLHTLTDQSSFIMVDVGSVKLWDINRDCSPVSLFKVPQQTSEITTSAATSALPSAVLVGDDSGMAKIIDLRQQAEDLSTSISFNVKDNTQPSRYCQGCEYIGSVAFSHDGVNIVARTFGEATVWDLRSPSKPVASLDVQWFPKYMDWLSNDEYTKDVFKTCFTLNGKILTGNYSADFISWDWKSNNIGKHKAISTRTPKAPPEPGKDFTKRVTVIDSHPQEEIVALVSTAALYIYMGKSE